MANARNVVHIKSALQILVDKVELCIVDSKLLLVCLELDHLFIINVGLLPISLLLITTIVASISTTTTSITSVVASFAATAPGSPTHEPSAPSTVWALTIAIVVSTSSVVARPLAVDCICSLSTAWCLVLASVIVCSLESLTKWLFGV